MSLTRFFSIILVLPLIPVLSAFGQNGSFPEFPPCLPTSEIAEDANAAIPEFTPASVPDLAFCARWNPEFAHNGHHCCGKMRTPAGRWVRKPACAPQRRKASYCDEMTQEQKDYSEAVLLGKIPDVLQLISHEMGRRDGQAYCSVTNGFLAWGRRLVPTTLNRIRLKNPARCTEFGTDEMIGMLEWVGRRVSETYSAPEYAGTLMTVGDISPPRGGCMTGRAGRRGHASHTTGQDVDLGFLNVTSVPGPVFQKKMEPKANWWFIKQIFQNPFACVKVIFLDRSHIRALSKEARGDEDWEKYRRFIRHIRGHRNHLHVRIGVGPGQPGCVADAKPELETEDDAGELEIPLSEPQE